MLYLATISRAKLAHFVPALSLCPPSLKLLPGPFGWDAYNAVAVTLTATEPPADRQALEAVLRHYSCYEPAIPKIWTCLQHSGIYQCILQRSWFRHNHKRCIADLAAVGVTLIIDYELYGAEKRPFSPKES